MTATSPDTITSQQFYLADALDFRRRALLWADAWSLVCYLDSNEDRQYRYQSYAALLAVGEDRQLVQTDARDGFANLRRFADAEPGWLFTLLGYDLKNDVEELRSSNFDATEMPVLHVFRADVVFEFSDKAVRISSSGELPERIYREVLTHPFEVPQIQFGLGQLQPRVSEAVYLDIVQRIREHIAAGDLYEMNYCLEFFAEQYRTDPLFLFLQLNATARAPFGAYYKIQDRYLLSASPERFLKKEGTRLISQPIKGTAPRGRNPREDAHLRDALFRSGKDRAENVMIVDLVRNDLARSCRPGSVRVEELFGIYSFNTVHQMISTVTGVLRPEVHWVDALRNAFPMGSMTGAPKVMSMELIEHYEATRRGAYSGAVGYVSPAGDFDFNVVIRSLVYNAATEYLSTHVGGAIVYDSEPEREYAECLLKLRTVASIV